MGDFKINKLNPFAWLGLAFYKLKNSLDHWDYIRSCKDAEKRRKKLDKEYYQDHKK